MGLFKDGYNSCMRYVLNNFFDGFRQVMKERFVLFLMFVHFHRMESIFSSGIIVLHLMKVVHLNLVRLVKKLVGNFWHYP